MLPNRSSSSLHRPQATAGALWIQAYVVFSGIIATFYAVIFVRRNAPWPMGDWLINYQGGFVRRGLPGEVILQLSRIVHCPITWIAAALQIGCVLLFSASLCRLTGKLFSRPTFLWQKALVLSPATLAFVWFDPSLILRKEVGLFAVLAFLTFLLSRERITDAAISAYLSLACLALLFSHEGLVCYLPYLFATVAVGRRSLKRMVGIGLAPASISLLPIALATRYTGTGEISRSVCNSIGGPQSGLCSGPIYYLGISRTIYESEVQLLLHDPRILWAFAITTALALLPVFVALADFWHRPVSRNTRLALPGAFVLSVAASMVLFVEAQDWSRWIYIHMVCLLLMLFFAATQRDADTTGDQFVPSPNRFRKGIITVALFVYATMWHLPEWILPGAREYRPFGYSSLLSRLQRHAPEGDLRDWHDSGSPPQR